DDCVTAAEHRLIRRRHHDAHRIPPGAAAPFSTLRIYDEESTRRGNPPQAGLLGLRGKTKVDTPIAASRCYSETRDWPSDSTVEQLAVRPEMHAHSGGDKFRFGASATRKARAGKDERTPETGAPQGAAIIFSDNLALSERSSDGSSLVDPSFPV